MSIIQAITHETEPQIHSKKKSQPMNGKNIMKDSSSKQRYSQDVELRQRIRTSRMIDSESELVEMNSGDGKPNHLVVDGPLEKGTLNGNANSQIQETSYTSSDMDADLAISWRRILLLIMAVTVHNIPEGLAVGVGFGSVKIFGLVLW